MSDIVERLKSWDRCYPGNINVELVVDEAADEITRLRAENERLLKLVKDAYYEGYRDRDGHGDAGTDDPEDRCAWRLSAAAAAILESGE
jgi:hypothetical protein